VKMLQLIDPPGKSICCCDVSKKSGVPKMCALPVAVGKSHCVDFKTHSGKPKAEALFPAYFLTEMGRGRGGLVAYTTKCIGEEKVPTKLWTCFEDESKSKGRWVQLMNDLRVRAVVGSEARADARKVLFSGGESSVLKAVFTPKKIRALPGQDSVHESEEDASWERLGFKPSSPPQLRDLGAAIEVMPPPSSVEGKTLNFRRALEDIDTSFGKLRTFGSKQQTDISDTIDDVISKVNTLSLGHDTLDQRVGLAQGFGEEAGMSSVFEGLQYLHDEFKDSKETFRKFPYEKMVKALRTFETDLEVLQTSMTALDPASLLDAVKLLGHKLPVVEESQKMSFESLKTNILPQIMQVVKHSGGNNVRNGADGPPLWDRVLALESAAKGVSETNTVGNDTLHGVYDVLGDEMGSKAQLEKLMNRLDNLERENTSLRSKVDELTTRSSLEARTASDENDALSSGGG
jgi:hypothetical protein